MPFEGAMAHFSATPRGQRGRAWSVAGASTPWKRAGAAGQRSTCGWLSGGEATETALAVRARGCVNYRHAPYGTQG